MDNTDRTEQPEPGPSKEDIQAALASLKQELEANAEQIIAILNDDK